MGKKHWKTIYKELEKPVQLYSDDGHSVAVLGKHSRIKAFELIKQHLIDGYGQDTDEYYNLRDSDQLEVALLRRPDANEYEDTESNFVAEKINRTEPRENDVWIYFVKI